MAVKTIFVTGGAGFIGSTLVRSLINNTDYHVINIDKLTYAGNLNSLLTVKNNDRYCFQQVDICNRVMIDDLLVKYQPDAIMHLAAESHVDLSITDSSDFMFTNIIGTFTLLEACRSYWEGLEKQKKAAFRFLHVSTDEVYGDLPAHSEPFDEGVSYAPSSPYSASKASADHLVRAWHRTYGLPILITNCSNNYGPYQYPEKLIPFVISNALQGKALPIYGKGQQIRDWLYVEDHVEALLRVLETGHLGQTYNIGGSNEWANIDVVMTLCNILDELSPIAKKPLVDEIDHYKQLITFVEDRPGHDERYAINNQKIKNDLGWSPRFSFEQGLMKTVIWYMEHQQWVNDVKNKGNSLSSITEAVL